MIDGDHLPRERCRISHRDLSNTGREPDALGGLRDRGEGGPHVEPGHRRVFPVDELIRGRRDVETEFLSVAKATKKFFPREVGEYFDLESPFENQVASLIPCAFGYRFQYTIQTETARLLTRRKLPETLQPPADIGTSGREHEHMFELPLRVANAFMKGALERIAAQVSYHRHTQLLIGR